MTPDLQAFIAWYVLMSSFLEQQELYQMEAENLKAWLENNQEME